MKEKISKIIKEALEYEEKILPLNKRLQDIDNWDSMSKLTLISLLDEHFNVQISSIEFGDIETVKDLSNLVESKIV